MRVVGEIPHPECKVTVFSWNNRYLIKVEQGMMEQTFKIDQFDVPEADLARLIDRKFIESCLERFEAMHLSLSDAMRRLDEPPQ